MSFVGKLNRRASLCMSGSKARTPSMPLQQVEENVTNGIQNRGLLAEKARSRTKHFPPQHKIGYCSNNKRKTH
eukprot:1458886-Amphidinium_carterae.1